MNLVKAFSVGALASLMTLGYLYYYDTSNVLNYKVIPFLLVLAYGVTNTLVIHFKQPFIIGGLFGLFLSVIGRFILNLPELVFKLQNQNIVHPVAFLLYSTYFHFVVDYLNKIVC